MALLPMPQPTTPGGKEYVSMYRCPKCSGDFAAPGNCPACAPKFFVTLRELREPRAVTWRRPCEKCVGWMDRGVYKHEPNCPEAAKVPA